MTRLRRGDLLRLHLPDIRNDGVHVQPHKGEHKKKGYPLPDNPFNFIIQMARPEGFEPPTAWFVASLDDFTYYINQSLAVPAHPIPYLSYQSLALH